jgi:hypothetical protein
VPAAPPEYPRPVVPEAAQYQIPTPTHKPARIYVGDTPYVAVHPIPILDITWVPTPTVGPISVPEPLPPWWWRLFPPDAFAGGGRQGAYRVQSGRRQLLALA